MVRPPYHYAMPKVDYYIYISLFAQKEQHKKQTIKKQQQTTKQTGTNTALTMISSHDMLGLLTGHNRRKCSQRDFSGHRHCGSDSHIVQLFFCFLLLTISTRCLVNKVVHCEKIFFTPVSAFFENKLQMWLSLDWNIRNDKRQGHEYYRTSIGALISSINGTILIYIERPLTKISKSCYDLALNVCETVVVHVYNMATSENFC